LVARGLSGVGLVVSDAHAGLVDAIACTLIADLGDQLVFAAIAASANSTGDWRRPLTRCA
jgi:transposase-like protein